MGFSTALLVTALALPLLLLKSVRQTTAVARVIASSSLAGGGRKYSLHVNIAYMINTPQSMRVSSSSAYSGSLQLVT